MNLQPKRLAVELALPGSVMAVSQATVRSKLSAEVKRVLVREGDKVSAGQILAEFDTAQLRALLAERTASYEFAKAQLANTERTRQVNAQLVKQNFISQNAFDTADSANQAQLAAVQASRAQVEQTQLQLNDSIVRAPISGIVAKRHVQPGEKLAFDAPLMAIVDLSELEVQVQVPVSDVPQIRKGMPASVDIEGIRGRSFAGRVERINPSTEPGTRTVNIYVSLPNEEALLKAGMFARVVLTTAPEIESPALPLSAVRSDGQQSYVWVIADGKLARRNVATGRRDERSQWIEVTSGLTASDVVLATKFDNLKDGLAAKVVGLPGEAKLADRRARRRRRHRTDPVARRSGLRRSSQMWMTRVSISHPVFATMVMVGLTVLGLFSYARLGIEPMPDVSPPGVQIWVNVSGCLARAGRKRPGQADRKRGQHGGGRQADPVALGRRPVADLGRVPLRSRHEPGDPGSARQARTDPRRIPARSEGSGRDARRRRERPARRVVRADRQGQFAARTHAAGRAGRAEGLRAGQGCRSRRPRRQRDAPDPGSRRPGQADCVRPVG